MGKILGLVLGLAVLAFVAFKSIYGHTNTERATPKEQLDNVKAAAKRIEDDQQKRADESLQKATPTE